MLINVRRFGFGIDIEANYSSTVDYITAVVYGLTSLEKNVILKAVFRRALYCLRKRHHFSFISCTRQYIGQGPAVFSAIFPLYRSHMGDLLDIMHQAKQVPLAVHFLLAA